MAKKKNPYKEYGISTQAIHTGTDYDEGTGAVRRPLHMANSYKLPDDLSQVNYSSTDLLMYSRNGNPNQHWLEEKIAALHDADDAIVLASGVAALHALFWTLLKTGDKVLYPKVSYMAVYRMFHELFNEKFGVETVMVDMTDLEAVKKAITPGTRLIHVETPDNPTNGVTDIAAIAKIAHENGAILSVDNTFASPYNQKPLELGADFVVEALTKFINGHGDAQGGAIISNDLETMDRIRYEAQVNVGSVISPFNAWQIFRGSVTFPLRMQRINESSQQIAEWLEQRENITFVSYPGLKSNAGHELAKKQMKKRYGGVISFGVDADDKAVEKFCAALKVVTFAVSLGHDESLIFPQPSYDERINLYPEKFRKGFIRFSVGLEEPEDIIADLDQALHKIGL
ncbi:PLP-dependent aspartate aminotransferase family protein [Kandleria sp.]|uniref:trans-sulfuration enzyme family protein n=1 Tax=Kandleria sp. TaxID=2774291 RepID=UPI001B3CB84F|nr:PLP-dependent aspartate aminotransferase family protein [Kandleria sp.]MBP3275282.1 PLP-dependent transferase [Kandleria sp.]